MYYFMSIALTIENEVLKDGTKFFVRLLVFCYEIILILILVIWDCILFKLNSCITARVLRNIKNKCIGDIWLILLLCFGDVRIPQRKHRKCCLISALGRLSFHLPDKDWLLSSARNKGESILMVLLAPENLPWKRSAWMDESTNCVTLKRETTSYQKSPVLYRATRQ